MQQGEPSCRGCIRAAWRWVGAVVRGRTLGHGVGVGQGGARPAADAAGSALAARDELGSAQCDSPARLGGDAAELACRSIVERCRGVGLGAARRTRAGTRAGVREDAAGGGKLPWAHTSG
eukprot:scaffold104697_cov67-Phaeocystis_antarctica.AAC.1